VTARRRRVAGDGAGAGYGEVMGMVDSAVYVDGVRVTSGSAPADAIAEARERGGMVWIGLSAPAGPELDELAGPLSLRPLAVQEAMRGHERSKLTQFDDGIFLALQPAHYDDATETVACHEADVYAGHDYIVTIINDDLIDAAAIRAQLERHPDVLAQGPFAVVWALLENVTRGYRAVLEGIENDIDEIEEQLFGDTADVSHRIFGLQREVIDLQHAIAPLPDMLERLEKLVRERTGAEQAPAFHEVRDRAASVALQVESFRTTLDNALTVHAAMVSQRNNEEMRRLTEFGIQQNDQVKKISSWAAILFAPTLVGTVYGMNFDVMPELHWQWGYPFALGLMLATSITLYVVFKKRGWL
jgi:magnesium transporter